MSDKAPIIIKKIKKGGHGGHHGGAWKVAYADFVTAMMAFFLLMWLLNATSEVQKRGISNYFGPAGHMVGVGGSGGILGGTAIDSEGAFDDSRANPPSGSEDIKPDISKDVDGEGTSSKPPPANATADALGKEKAQADMKKKEDEMFKEVEGMIRQAIEETPDLKDLAQNLIVENTPEGLRIQIVDKDRYSMFPNGKADMYPHTKQMLQKVAKIISTMPNQISIFGHTDAKPFSGDSHYTNWELSSDRANATRRELLSQGFPQERIMNVVGKADREPLLPAKPEDDQNRRISIVLLRNQKP
jgi:chemotaxis protein MotB